MRKYFLLFLTVIFLSACATYYQRQEDFNNNLLKGDLVKADEVLAKDKKAETGKNRLLYFLNRGAVNWMMGKSAESTVWFNKADLCAEDYQKNYATKALSFISNPMAVEYRGEDFEIVLIHYYKAINYLQLNNYENALVECRRLNIRLNQLNDKYTKKNRYSVDAFGLNLMGIVYDASGDYNNAFVSYRNALEAYENSYAKQFGVNPPMQLKQDLMRAAYRSGFTSELEFYEKKFNLKFNKQDANKGELVFFWNNGLGPVKAENSINFTIIRGQGGMVTFANSEFGMNFPFYLPATKEEKSALANLEFIRVAFPKYIERKPYFNKAYLEIGNEKKELEVAENINNIAFKTLDDRMLRELGESLLRLAIKKGIEYQIRKENPNAGALAGIVNAVTEKADTRNWQTLPYSISYTRMLLQEGNNTVTLRSLSADKRSDRSQNFNFNIKKGKTEFHAYQHLESFPPSILN